MSFRPPNFFFVEKSLDGRYKACVDLYPEANGVYRYCRDASSWSEANTLLACLKRELAQHPGLVTATLEAWQRGELCSKAVPHVT